MRQEEIATFVVLWLDVLLLILSLGCPNLRAIWVTDLAACALALILSQLERPRLALAVHILAYGLFALGLYVFLTSGCYGYP